MVMASPGAPPVGLTRHISKRLVLSYMWDWIVILVVAGAGGALYKIVGNKHAFSLDDRRISYPLRSNTVSIAVVVIIALVAPGIIIAILSLLLSPARALTAKGSLGSRSLVWRQKLWEWNTGWMGLGLSLAGAFFVTSGLKDLVGKPRPNLIARCDPDLSQIRASLVGGLGLVFEEAPVLVDVRICRQTDSKILNDGFAAFPSGHSSFAWAGLLYLTLWLCARFSISIPYLAPMTAPQPNRTDPSLNTVTTAKATPAQNQSAAPPLYLLTLALIPTGASIYVAASRWNDYQHSGFDIIAGSLIGALFAWFGFRFYHPPIAHGLRGAWGPRSRDRAFYTGSPAVGIDVGWGWRGGWVGSEGWASRSWEQRGREGRVYEDLELGRSRGRPARRSADGSGSREGNTFVAGGIGEGAAP